MQKAEELFQGKPWATTSVQLSGGSRISLVDGGQGHPVLLLHGFPERWFSWQHQMDALLSAGYRVIVPDLPGYGSSVHGTGDHSVPALAELFGELLEKLGVESCHLVGHDWGGIIGFELAARFPWRVDRLALLNGPPLPAIEALIRDEPSQALRLWYGLLFQAPLAAEMLASDPGRRLLSWVLERTLVRPADDLIRLWVDSIDTGKARAAVAYYRAAFKLLLSPLQANERQKMRLSRVRCQSLVIWGEDDWALDAKLIRYIEKLHTGWLTFRPIRGAGHFVQQDAPEEVNRHLLEFFAQKTRQPEKVASWR